MTRTVVSVACGRERFSRNAYRLADKLTALGEALHWWDGVWPPGSPSHEAVPFAFKVHALEAAAENADVLLWCDSSIVPIAPLAPLWERIERDGYWLSRNYDYKNGEFTSDAALAIMGQTRDEAMLVPHVIATAFGLDMTSYAAQALLDRWRELMLHGAFAVGGSTDPRFRGHRHDQSALSHIAWELALTLTTPPRFIAEGGMPVSGETVLVIERA